MIIVVKSKPKTNRLKKPFKNSEFLKSNIKEHLFCRTSASDCFLW